jgi:hypothetical protein
VTSVPDNSDVLLGAAAITGFINELVTTRVTQGPVYRWIEARHIPSGRLGAKVIGSKKRLREHFERLTAGG